MSPQTQRPRTDRPSRKRHRREGEILVDRILKEGAAQAAEVATALALRSPFLTEDELQSWHRDMERRLQKIHEHPEQNLGFVEEEVARGSRECNACCSIAPRKPRPTPRRWSARNTISRSTTPDFCNVRSTRASVP